MLARHLLGRVGAALAVAAVTITLTSRVAIAASQFVGTWKTQDTNEKPFEITLSEDGKAKGDRAGEALTGTWKAEDDSAVIDWGDGWTTKIIKQGSQFKKQAFQNGKPKGTADAQKVR